MYRRRNSCNKSTKIRKDPISNTQFLPVFASSGGKKVKKQKHCLSFKAREKESSEKIRRNSTCQIPPGINQKTARVEKGHQSWWRCRWTAQLAPKSRCPDVDTRADNHFSCLDKGYYKYSCSHHHCYQSDIPEEMQHFLRESILTISAWASSLWRFKKKKKSHQLLGISP